MVEQMRSVSNPLTIIALFAALSEAAGTVSLATIDKDSQHVFVWFVMGFPILLVLAFFITLNFNSKVLYAPGDFKNEENFLAMVKANAVSTQLSQVDMQLEAATKKIMTLISERVSPNKESERKQLFEIVNQELGPIQTAVASSRNNIESIVDAAFKLKDSVIPGHKGPFTLSSVNVTPSIAPRGKTLTISYVIESTEDSPTNLWLGASFTGPSGAIFYNTKEDKPISVKKGNHVYSREFTIAKEAPLGPQLLRAELWRGPVSDSKGSIILSQMRALFYIEEVSV